MNTHGFAAFRAPGTVSISCGCIFGGLIAVLPAGCQTPPASRPDLTRPTVLVPDEIVAGQSVEGRSMICQILGGGQDTVFVLAGIHGNEPAGVPLVRELLARLSCHAEVLEGRRVIALAEANPDGLAKGTRRNARNVDVNRNFPASNWSSGGGNGPSPLSEPESRAIDEMLKMHRPDRIVSIHQPLGLIDYDGPAQALAEFMAARCDLPVKKLGGRSGSLGSYAGITRGIPIVTVELPRSASRLDDAALWERYGMMLAAAVFYPQDIPPALRIPSRP